MTGDAKMGLARASVSFLAWLYRLHRKFLQHRRILTSATIAALVLSRVTNLLAFLLPLKVILLAGSAGVPRYFEGFIHPAQKTEWIIALSVAAFVSYGATLALDSLIGRWAGRASNEVLREANDLVVVANQFQVGEHHFTRACQVVAGVLFICGGLAAGLVLNPLPFTVISLLVVIQCVATELILKSRGAVFQRLRGFVRDALRDYLKVLSSFTFLAGFLLILAPFVLTPEANILIGILSIVIVRQTVRAGVSVFTGAISLVEQRSQIDALFFPSKQLQHRERTDVQRMRSALEPEARRGPLADMVREHLRVQGAVAVHWADSSIRGLAKLDVETDDASHGRYQLQVFSGGAAWRLDNENLLFRHMGREQLLAPNRVAEIAYGPFRCQLYDLGRGIEVPRARWRAWYRHILCQLWAEVPPVTLVKAYARSHFMLHSSFSRDALSRLAFALDTDEESAIIERLRSRRRPLARVLKGIPLYVHNGNITRGQTRLYSKAAPVLLDWGRWQLLPVGAVLPVNSGAPRLERMLETLKKDRPSLDSTVSVDHLRLASSAWQFQEGMRSGRLKAALGYAEQLLENPLTAGRSKVERKRSAVAGDGS